ncbi:VTT domain-containing protein [Cellulomonas sp.]|uniref:VTT domain-containing protein n=1 Tax=Cellulomonas sp. TaxID=40001 RepID=UPI001B2C7550|nr:VTT domain-containing protein [Cellulomonas sp.]MBO9553567.1 VTT domain-containing protein [Cellulomonas sp.]
MSVRHYVLLTVGLLVALTAMFVAVEAAGFALLTDPTPAMGRVPLAVAAALGVTLLVVDVVLPVPSSVVMVLHGTLFGAVAGSLLSLAGAVGATVVGYLLGRGGAPLVARVAPVAEQDRAAALLGRWGPLAIVVTRPLPLLAETTAIVAGTTRALSVPRVAAWAAVGAAAPAVAYAVAGASAAGGANLPLVFAAVVALAAATWLLGRRTAGTS